MVCQAPFSFSPRRNSAKSYWGGGGEHGSAGVVGAGHGLRAWETGERRRGHPQTFSVLAIECTFKNGWILKVQSRASHHTPATVPNACPEQALVEVDGGVRVGWDGVVRFGGC